MFGFGYEEGNQGGVCGRGKGVLKMQERCRSCGMLYHEPSRFSSDKRCRRCKSDDDVMSYSNSGLGVGESNLSSSSSWDWGSSSSNDTCSSSSDYSSNSCDTSSSDFGGFGGGDSGGGGSSSDW